MLSLVKKVCRRTKNRCERYARNIWNHPIYIQRPRQRSPTLPKKDHQRVAISYDNKRVDFSMSGKVIYSCDSVLILFSIARTNRNQVSLFLAECRNSSQKKSYRYLKMAKNGLTTGFRFFFLSFSVSFFNHFSSPDF